MIYLFLFGCQTLNRTDASEQDELLVGVGGVGVGAGGVGTGGVGVGTGGVGTVPVPGHTFWPIFDQHSPSSH